MRSFGDLVKQRPDSVINDKGQIGQLFAQLKPKGEKAEHVKLQSRDGYTYHLLGYDEKKGTVFHVRVLITGGSTENISEVYLNPMTQFSFLNDNVGAWLIEKVNSTRKP